tara:strand:- start:4301 stop:4534 length:234 start_codon:yes stop_codon:yes gene_type:complete
MKTIRLLLILLVLASFSGSDYCDGFEEGFCEGVKFVEGDNAVCPPTPVCPIPEADENTYRDGYNRGFARGREEADKD